MHHRNAFTLIELLVVISIIALLVSILLPALGSARAAAIMMQCSSQTRTVGQATHMYMADNNTFYPWKVDGVSDPSGDVRWYGILNSYMGGERTREAAGERSAWHCPAVYEESIQVYGPGIRASLYGGNPWIYNWRLADGTAQHINYRNRDYPAIQMKEAMIEEPSTLVMVLDARRPTWWPMPSLKFPTSSFGYRVIYPHFGDTRFLNSDGTVVSSGPTDTDGQAAPVFADGHGATLSAFDYRSLDATGGMDTWRADN